MPCENNKSMTCPCTYPCSKNGKCCECVAYHLRSGEFPACFFSAKAEKTYDRGLQALINDRKQR